MQKIYQKVRVRKIDDPRTMLNHQKSETIRNKRKKRELSSSSSSLLDLPQPLVTDIVGHVVSSSFTDFFIIRSICKDFYQIPEEEEGYIYRQMCLEKFPVVAWRNVEKHSEFFKRCHDNRNPEALYREGVIEYFGRWRLEIAIKYLEEATNSGHMGAYYAMGVIYIFSGDELKKQKGIAILGELRKSNTERIKLKDYRESLKLILSGIWKNPLIKEKRPVCCTKTMQHQKKKTGWSIDDEIPDNGNICEACASDSEIEFITGLL